MGSQPVHCPVCQRQFDPQQSGAAPFCSDRCRLIDLKRWLDEQYGLPYERPEAEESPEDE